MPICQGIATASAIAAAAAAALWPHVAAGQSYYNETLTGTTVVPDDTTVMVVDHLTLDNAQVDVLGTLDFRGNSTIGGTGRIDLLAGGSVLVRDLTVLNGVEIVGNRNHDPSPPNIARITTELTDQQDTLINYGMIAAEGSPATELTDLIISSSVAVNHGSIIARQDSVLSVSWKNGWRNLGTFRAEDGGVFELSGTIDPSRLGSLIAVNGGVFALRATVNNAGQTWTLDQTTGSFRLRYATINGGRIVGNDNVKLYSPPVGGLGTLLLNGGVVLDIDVDILSTYSNIKVADGLTINRSFVFKGKSLEFNGAQTLDGTGELRVSEGMYINADLTIAPGMTVRGESSVDGYFSNRGAVQLHNQGTMIDLSRDWSSYNRISLLNSGIIRSESRAVYLPAQAVNTGQLISDAGSLHLDHPYQDGRVTSLNNGSIWIEGGTNTANGSINADGGNLRLKGAITNHGTIELSSGRLLWDDPVITGNPVSVTDGTIVILSDHASDQLPSSGFVRSNTGWGLAGNTTLDNTGRTLNLTSDRQTQWTLYEGTVLGGVIDSPDETPLRVQRSIGAASFVALDGVELRAPVVIESKRPPARGERDASTRPCDPGRWRTRLPGSHGHHQPARAGWAGGSRGGPHTFDRFRRPAVALTRRG